MKRLTLLSLFSGLLAGCSTITVNLGDESIRQAAGCGTNAVSEASCDLGTNGTQRAAGSASILIQINMNAQKDIKPDSTLTLTQ
jgi:hypothetical protein